MMNALPPLPLCLRERSECDLEARELMTAAGAVQAEVKKKHQTRKTIPEGLTPPG